MSVEIDRLIDLIHELMGKIYKDERGIWRIENFDSDQKGEIWKALMAIARNRDPEDDEGDMGGMK